MQPDVAGLSLVTDADGVAQALVAGGENAVTLLDVKSGRTGHRLDGSLLRTLALDRSTLIATHRDEVVQLYDLVSGRPVLKSRVRWPANSRRPTSTATACVS